MEKIPFVLIEEKYNQYIKSNKVGLTRFMSPVIQKSENHTYLNIYNDKFDTKRSSCIECDNYLTFDVENCIMVYKNMGSVMLYKFFSKNDTEKIKKLFE